MFRMVLALCLLGNFAVAQVRVVDGDTLDLDGQRYRLNGIDAPEAGQKCTDSAGRSWDCGEAATAALEVLVRKGRVGCDAISQDGFGRTIARCTGAGGDLGRAMVDAGMAWAFLKFSDEYASAQAKARADRRGIWQGPAQPAWEFRALRWADAAKVAPKGCPIKGNISRNGRIYHTPWSPWYSRTRINTAKGERWFCDEAEALAAGWRAPVWK